MYKGVLNKFESEIQRILEDFNIYPKARAIQGRQAPVPAQNVNSTGPLPTGFKGSGPAGIAPGGMATILIKTPKKKRKKKKKRIRLRQDVS
jgi:hypothetical protein